MPEGYTHVRTAHLAAEAMHYEIQCPEAFAAGANGPDSFFCFEVWRRAKNRRYDLPALGHRMHEERTGEFLWSLCRLAGTRSQKEYTLGFLCHYAADTVIHPFICAMCEPGMPYAGAGGHGYLEIALDSELHKEDTGDSCVPPSDTSPLPPEDQLSEIALLLRQSLKEVYALDIPVEYLEDAFRHTWRVRGLFTSRFGVRRAAFSVLERFMGRKGFITGHISPRKLSPDLPDVWTDPFGSGKHTGGIGALLSEAQARCEKYMSAAERLWSGEITGDAFRAVIGSASYVRGCLTAASCGL